VQTQFSWILLGSFAETVWNGRKRMLRLPGAMLPTSPARPTWPDAVWCSAPIKLEQFNKVF